MEDKNIIEIKNLNKWYGDFHVLKDINMNVLKRVKSSLCADLREAVSLLLLGV